MGPNVSLWMATSEESPFASQLSDLTTDVVVVGGGIAGILAAYQLAERGNQVVVLERGRVSASVTGYTTAKVTVGHGLIYDKVASNAGEDYARAYFEANQWGVEWIARIAAENGIQCDLDRRPMLVFAESESEREQVEKDIRRAIEAGAPASWTDQVDLPIRTLGALRYENQIQFHPTNFVRGIARQLVARGGQIFENTTAVEFDEDDGGCTVRTNSGEVRAKYMVIASHYPVYDPAMYLARLAPYRDYALAVKLRGGMPFAMSIGAGESGKSFRMSPSPEGDLLVVGGEGHKVGQEPNTEERYRKLEDYVRQHFDVESIPYRWSTQDNMTPDSMPYIGRISPGSERAFVITGFNAWGMSTAPYAGRIIADLVARVDNPWAKYFDPNRFKGFESVKHVVKENVNAVKHLIGDKLSGTDDLTVDQIRPGEAAVITLNGKKAGVYRDPSGSVHAISPVCTHIGCDIGWNPAETTWDCPCHGSRFNIHGEVIQGPAIKNLERISES